MKGISKVVVALFVATLANLSFASMTTNDLCASLPGTWHGKGELRYFFFNCEYDSVASVSDGVAQITISKISGNFMCPKQESQITEVRCNNGRVTMKDSKIDVAGNMSLDGHSAILEGSLYASYRYHPFKLSVNKG